MIFSRKSRKLVLNVKISDNMASYFMCFLRSNISHFQGKKRKQKFLSYDFACHTNSIALKITQYLPCVGELVISSTIYEQKYSQLCNYQQHTIGNQMVTSEIWDKFTFFCNMCLSKLGNFPSLLSSFELFSIAVLLDKRRMYAGLALSQCKLFTNTNENANKCR